MRNEGEAWKPSVYTGNLVNAVREILQTKSAIIAKALDTNRQSMFSN